MSKKKTPVFVNFIIIVLILLVGFNILQRKKAKEAGISTEPNLIERIATLNDIEIKESYKFPASSSVTVTPKKNIKNLTLKIDFLDSAGKIITSCYLNYGNVTKNVASSKEISIMDFSLSEMLSMGGKCRYIVYDGTVSLF